VKEYLVEINKKYSIPVACFVFVLVGAPLGVMARRGGFGVAASLSLGFFLLYWASLIGGEKLADRELLEPWVGMWMANIFIFVIGMILTLRIARENVEIDLSFLSRLIPKRFRSSSET
jgi:lipopolysaccharide export system permease protein